MQARARIRGVVILYATIAVGMLGVLGTTMSDGSQAAVDAVQASLFTQMARYAAESGIETAIAALDAHLSAPCAGLLAYDPISGKLIPVSTSSRNPMCDNAYAFEPCRTAGGLHTIGWADAEPGTDEEKCIVGDDGGAKTSVKVYEMSPPGWQTPDPVPLLSGPEGDRERIAQRFITSFTITMAPTFNYRNAKRRYDKGGFATFAIRSRGMVRAGKDPENATGRQLVGQAVLVAKVRVGEGCVGTLSGDYHSRIERISMDLVPAYDRPGMPLPAVKLPH